MRYRDRQCSQHSAKTKATLQWIDMVETYTESVVSLVNIAVAIVVDGGNTFLIVSLAISAFKLYKVRASLGAIECVAPSDGAHAGGPPSKSSRAPFARVDTLPSHLWKPRVSSIAVHHGEHFRHARI